MRRLLPIATQLDDATGWPSAGSYGTDSRKLVVGARDDIDNGSYSSYHSGDIAEIMLFDVALDAAARGAIEASSKTKYGLCASRWDVGSAMTLRRRAGPTRAPRT